MKKTVAISKCWFSRGIIAALAMLMPAYFAEGQQKPEPSAVVAIAPIDEQLKDLEYMGKATSEMAGAMSGMLRMQAQGFMAGIDFRKPAGAYLYFGDQPQPEVVAFLPITELNQVLDRISEVADVEENGDTVTIIPDNGPEMTLVSAGGYAFISNQADLLKNLPSNPAAELDSLAKAYNISVQLFPQRVPAELREQAIEWIRDSYESALEQMEDNEDLPADLQDAQFESQMKQIEMMVHEVDRLTLGFKADRQAQRMYMDVNMKGLDSSDMSKRLLASKTTTPSAFAGFLMEKAAFTLHNCSGVTSEDVEIYLQSLDQMRDLLTSQLDQKGDGRKTALFSELSDQVTESVKKTLRAGVLDLGGVAFTDNGLNAAFGGKLLDARNLESAIKKLVAESRSDLADNNVQVNLDVGSHLGYTMHEIKIGLDEDEVDENVVKMFGPHLTLILSVGDNAVYVGLGRDPASTLKMSIDANSSGATKSDMVGQYNFFVAPIMNLVSQIEAENEIVQILRDKILEVGKDRIRIAYDVVDGEFKTRMEMQDGILRMLGTASERMQGMGGPGADF